MWAGLFLMIMAGSVAVTGFVVRPAPDSFVTSVEQGRTLDMDVDPTELRARGNAGNIAYYHSVVVDYVIQTRKKKSVNSTDPNDPCKTPDGSRGSFLLYERSCYDDTGALSNSLQTIAGTSVRTSGAPDTDFEKLMNLGFYNNVRDDKFGITHTARYQDVTIGGLQYLEIRTRSTLVQTEIKNRGKMILSLIAPELRKVNVYNQLETDKVAIEGHDAATPPGALDYIELVSRIPYVP